MVRQGVMDHPPKTPVIMGFECSGVVEAVGENTTGFAVSCFNGLFNGQILLENIYVWFCHYIYLT